MKKSFLILALPLAFSLPGASAVLAATLVPEFVEAPPPQLFPVPLKVGASLTYDLVRLKTRDSERPPQLLGTRVITVERVDESGGNLVAGVRQLDVDLDGKTLSDYTYDFVKTSDWVVTAKGVEKTRLFPIPVKPKDFLESCSSVKDLPNGNWEGKSDKRWTIDSGMTVQTSAGTFDCSSVFSRYVVHTRYKAGTYDPQPQWEGTVESTRSVELLLNDRIGLVEMSTTEEKGGQGVDPVFTSLVYRIASYSIPVSKQK